MCIVVNTEIFIERSKAIYGAFFQYHNTVYEHMRRNLTITCPVHGDFIQRAKQHLKGAGCPTCSSLKEGARRRAEKAKTFESRSIKVNGGKYLYHLANYTESDAKVTIVCPKHGPFDQVAGEHLKGRGCPLCAAESISEHRTLSIGDIEQRLSEREGTKYPHDLSGDINTDSKIKFKCPTHGWFSQRFGNYMNGNGCPKCSTKACGYQRRHSGSIYVLRYGDYLKVGITNKPVETRVKQISKSFGKEFEIVTYMTFSDGAIPDEIETQILKELKAKYEQPSEKFDGSTECFLNASTSEIIKRIGVLASEQFN